MEESIKQKLVLLLILISFAGLFADGTEPEGSGTQADPYQVEILDNLLWISTNDISWDKHFIQTAGINASDTQNWNNGEGFIPIGFDDVNPFSGCYDGQDYTIDYLHINPSSNGFHGLFGFTSCATIENLGVTNVDVSGFDAIGGLAGCNNNSTISNCYCTGVVDGSFQVGGLVGFNYGSIVSNCYSAVNVSGDYDVGGLVGDIGSSTINNSYYNYDMVLINGENVITIGALDNEKYEIWINNGLTLNIDNYLVSNGPDYLISSVEDLKTLLAFGQSTEYSFLLESYLDLSSETNFHIPYFSGEFNGNGYIIDNLNVNMGSFSDLGLFGDTNGATIKNLGVTNIDVIGNFYVGGLVGKNYNSNINNCYTSGNTYGFYYIGGLVGNNRFNSTISNCYSTGSVSGGGCVGGFAGGNSFDSVINYCYSTSSVSGDYDVGGLVGNNIYSNVLNSFWDIETSGQTTSTGGTGKTTAEMLNVATYTDLSTVGLDIPWDFVGNPFDDTSNEDFWDIDDEINNGYPYLANPLTEIDNEEIIEITEVSKLIGNYPNPFNPTTTISFSVTQTISFVTLDIYNIKGQKVKSLVKESFESGNHSVIWDGNDDTGKPVSSGIYFYRLNVNGKSEAVKKCLLLK